MHEAGVFVNLKKNKSHVRAGGVCRGARGHKGHARVPQPQRNRPRREGLRCDGFNRRGFTREGFNCNGFKRRGL